MTAGWVAASLRGRSLLERTWGAAGARSIATAPTWGDAGAMLTGSIAGRSLPSGGADRAAARRAATEATVWQLRVLAGWVPPTDTGLMRVAAAPFEIGNIERHVATLAGARRVEPVELGSLAVAWPRVASCATADAVRVVLRRSVWGDPGGADLPTLASGLRVAWLRRVRRTVPDLATWTTAGIAVLAARERFVFGRDVARETGREVDRALGRRWRDADSLASFVAGLSPGLDWPFADVVRTDDLWLAERALVAHVADDARRRLSRTGYDRATVVAVATLLLVDLWLTHAAIEVAGHGAMAEEVFDGVAV